MWNLYLLIAFIVYADVNAGGTPTPFYVEISDNQNTDEFCLGVILDTTWVVSMKSCLDDLGTYNRLTTFDQQAIEIESVRFHSPSESPDPTDLALIELKSKMVFTNGLVTAPILASTQRKVLAGARLAQFSARQGAGPEPHHAMVYPKEHQLMGCEGIIMDTSWIVVCAHCLESMKADSDPDAELTVQSMDGQTIAVKSIISHPDPDLGSPDDIQCSDVAVLELESRLIFSDAVHGPVLPEYED